MSSVCASGTPTTSSPAGTPPAFLPVRGSAKKLRPISGARRHGRSSRPTWCRQCWRSVLAQIRGLAQQHLHGVLPGSLLGKALHYVTAQWPKLERYVDDGRYPIDNNACENAIRPFVVGRRNWLFADTVAGATASANLYSLQQTCMANGIDGYKYLKALFVELPKARTVDDFDALLPWHINMGKR